MNERQQAMLRAHYMQCYQRAHAEGFRCFAQTIYEFFIAQWPNEVLDWPLILGGIR